MWRTALPFLAIPFGQDLKEAGHVHSDLASVFLSQPASRTRLPDKQTALDFFISLMHANTKTA